MRANCQKRGDGNDPSPLLRRPSGCVSRETQVCGWNSPDPYAFHHARELYHAKDLLKKGMLKNVWKMFRVGKTAEPRKETGFTFTA